ncbi:WD40 repeat domain-containing serine/threonine protein kinase [Streptosporangium vulgare]|uniref:WD40 repeat domain-containing serine/threonine protein kinase n=1 Tax=Streptosporangium vulgare TaxID=46190 RepID=A0ABV5TFH5_9ACTN
MFPLSETDPRQIGDYRLSGVAGEGGQGVVYLGHSPSGARVAIKVLHARMARDPGVRRRFLREIDLARKVAPFCTARVLDTGMTGDRPYVVSEYVPGPSLQDLVAGDGPRTGGGLERLAVTTLTTLTALTAVHRASIVHRDFKPANVVMGPEGPVVIDFGIAQALEQVTTSSGPVGTPAYMAPELFASQPATTACDVFSWAATMVFAATGRRAFPGDDATAVIGAIVLGQADLSGVPTPLDDLLAACLDKDPAARPTITAILSVLTGEHATPGRAAPAESPAAAPGSEDSTGHVVARPPDPVPPPARGDLDQPMAPSRQPSTMPAGPARRRVLLSLAAVGVVGGGAAIIRTLQQETPATGSPDVGRSGRPASAPATPHARAQTSAPSPSTAQPPFGTPLSPPLTGHTREISAVAIAAVDGRTVAISGTHYDYTLRIWDLAAGRQIRKVQIPDSVWTMATGTVNGTPVAVTGDNAGGGGDNGGALNVWDLTSGKQIGEPVTGYTDAVSALALGTMNGNAVAVFGYDDRYAMWVYDLTAGRRIGRPLTGHTDAVTGAAIHTLGDRIIAVTGSDDRTLRVWDLATGQRVGRPLTGPDPIQSLALGTLDGKVVAVTGGARKIRIWDLAAGELIGRPLTGHTDSVNSMAFGTLEGRPIAVSGGAYDRTVRVWDLAAGRQIGRALVGNTRWVHSVAVGTLNGVTIAVAGGDDLKVRAWSLGAT